MNDILRRLLADVKNAIYDDQPYLNVVMRGQSIIVEGTYLLIPTLSEHLDREPLANHNLRIEISPDYPKVEPQVTMLDRSIPWDDRYHCSKTGVCCITVFESWAASSIDPSVKGYLKGPLRNFFLSQLLKKQGKDWPFGEWAHGDVGFIAAIADIIGCPPRRNHVINILRWHAGSPEGVMEESTPCPCESGKTIFNCCSTELERFRTRISAVTADAWLTRFLELTSSRTPLDIQREIHKNRPFRRVQ